MVLRMPVGPFALLATGLSPSVAVLSNTFAFGSWPLSWSYNPTGSYERVVWAPPVSLATTAGISLDFFSSGY